jgi:phage I-like protein
MATVNDSRKHRSADPCVTDAAVVVNLTSRVLRLALAEPIPRDGKELYNIPICVTGCWVKGGRKFSITRDDLVAMVRNFEKRKNEQVVIDYEHASEQPTVARGGPVPAAGWIHDLTLPEPGVEKSKLGTPNFLHALVEWTQEALELLKDGAYRFFSPAIDWTCRDKETGQPQGATLTSGALTNHPFLEELPAIALSDVDQEAVADGSNLQLERPLSRTSVEPGEGENREKMKKLTIKPLTEGELKGCHGIFDEDGPLGYLDPSDLADYLKTCDNLENSAMNDMLRESGFATGGSGLVREQVLEHLKFAAEVRARTLETAGRNILLGEAVREGALDNHKAAALAREGKIALADYIAAQEADKKLDEAVRAGKILPRDRKFFFHDALERPREFGEYLRQAVPVVPLRAEGLGTAGEIGVDDEVKIRTQRLMSEEKLSFAKALRRVFAADRELEHRYHALHRQEIGSDPDTAREPDGRGITA